ncbi:MAG: DUF3575 domain-containing protein [Prevotellaceae bacterium]|jgi:hypothetical protein|nr:DUF3575 domain-containing protein [Prevotellaceae bacterium]
MKRYLFIFTALLYANVCFSQGKQPAAGDLESPKLVIKTNALYWLLTTPNLSVETALSDKLSLDIASNFNPWKFGAHARFQHFLIQPELRYWLDKPMKGHYFGFHVHYLYVNVGFIDTHITVPFNLHLSFMPDFRKQGNIYGLGFSYGYNWRLNAKWALEGVLSIGYAHLKYNTYQRDGYKFPGYDYYNYVGPTKLAANLIYIIK